jgi:hypothetical protein
VLEQKGDDDALLASRSSRAGVALPGVLYGEMQRRRPSLVPETRIRTACDERSHRTRAPSPNGPMEGRDSALVRRVGVRARVDEVSDHLALGHRIPVDGAGSSICGIVEWLRSPPVSSANIRAVLDEPLGEFASICGSSHMECRVASTHVVVNGTQEIPVAVFERMGGEVRCCLQTSRGGRDPTRRDLVEQRGKRATIMLVESPALVEHPTEA